MSILKILSVIFSSIFEGIGEFLSQIRRWVEARTIIPIIEGVMRIWYHLDPRVYFESLRVKRVSEGNADRKSNKYAIITLYMTGSLPRFTTNILEAIERSPLNLVIVSNVELDPYLRAQLLDKCHLLIERANLGRDFGAYKDGLAILQRHAPDMDRVILLNDSLFFFQRGLDKLVADLNGIHDFIGVTEVFEFHYHVQSFMLSFGAAVIRSRAFRQFWKKYRPISTRRWSIHKGEVRLTRRLTKAGFRPHVLFQAAQLIAHLRPRPIREILEAVRLLPVSARRKLYREFSRILGEDRVSPAEFEAISQGVRTVSPAGLPARSGAATVDIARQLESMDRWSFEIFANKLVSTIAQRNQVHVGGFLFMKYLGLPAIKRDVFYREVYTLEEIYRVLSDFNEPLRDEVMSDLRRGGTAMHLKGLSGILYYHGSI